MYNIENIEEYCMIESCDLSTFNNNVNSYLKKKWKLYGPSYAFLFSPGINDMIIYSQAVVKYNENQIRG